MGVSRRPRRGAYLTASRSMIRGGRFEDVVWKLFEESASRRHLQVRLLGSIPMLYFIFDPFRSLSDCISEVPSTSEAISSAFVLSQDSGH